MIVDARPGSRPTPSSRPPGCARDAERTATRNRAVEAVCDERRRAETEAVRLADRIRELARGRLDALAAHAAEPILAALEPVTDHTAGPTSRTPCDESSAARR
jgi:hypothetical protein